MQILFWIAHIIVRDGASRQNSTRGSMIGSESQRMIGKGVLKLITNTISTVAYRGSHFSESIWRTC